MVNAIDVSSKHFGEEEKHRNNNEMKSFLDTNWNRFAFVSINLILENMIYQSVRIISQ